MRSSSAPCDEGCRRIFQADVRRLREMREFVEHEAERLGAGEAVVHDAALATDEAVCNIITHGYRDEGGEIGITVGRTGSDLVIRILDDAPAFDPTKYPAPDLTVPLELRKPGGFGIFLMKNMMDDVSYRRLPGGRNELVLTRRSAFERDADEPAGGRGV